MPRGVATRPRRNGIPVESAVLRWARESIGFSIEDAARRIGVKAERLEKWEEKDAVPTPRQLSKFADTYKRPLAVFFRATPPEESPLPVDFRMFPKGGPHHLKPKSSVAVRRARYLQESYAELHGPPEVLLGRFDPNDADRSARDLRARLKIEISEIASLKTSNDALNTWRGAIEGLGILVFQFTFPPDEMRGFSLPGEAPAVVLSSQDALAARCFTLFHETAHLGLGKPGICNTDGAIRQKSGVEAYCNAFAAEFLVPFKEFSADQEVRAFAGTPEGENAIRRVLAKVARRFYVSQQVVLRRLFTAGLVNQSRYEEWASRLAGEAKARLKEEREKAKNKDKPGGPSPSTLVLSQLGEPFVRTVLDARDQGRVTESEVTDYFAVSYNHVEKIEAKLS